MLVGKRCARIEEIFADLFQKDQDDDVTSNMGLTATTNKKYVEINGSSVDHPLGQESLDEVNAKTGHSSFMKSQKK